MLFKTKEKRMRWLNIFTWLIIDIFLGVIISWYFEGGFWLVLLIIILFQIVFPIIFLIRHLFYWIVFYKIIKKVYCDKFYSELIINKFPAPREVEDSTASYFDHITSQNVINKKAILLTAFYIGYLQCLKDTGNLIFYFTINSGLEEAIEKYKTYLIELPNKNDSDSKL